jgi:hypothetical protein
MFAQNPDLARTDEGRTDIARTEVGRTMHVVTWQGEDVKKIIFSAWLQFVKMLIKCLKTY